MCIRDRCIVLQGFRKALLEGDLARPIDVLGQHILDTLHAPCLLYTSDAADERSSVDLGGRRIIKKKHNVDHTERKLTTQKPK